MKLILQLKKQHERIKNTWYWIIILVSMFILDRWIIWILYGLEIANKHRLRYLKRALNIKGDWKENEYSSNNDVYVWIL